MGAILLALASSAAWGVADFLGGSASKTRPPTAVYALSQAIAVIPLTIVVLAVAGAPAAGIDVTLGVIGGLAGGLGLLCLYQALAIGPMGVVAPIFSLGALVPVAVGVLSGERLSWLQCVGVVAAIAGCSAAARGSNSDRAIRKEGIVAALLAALGLGVGVVGLDAAADADPLWAVEITRLSAFAGICLVVVATRPRLIAHARPLAPILAIGTFDTLANVCLAIASTMGLLSVVAVLSSIYPVVTVLLARVVLGEELRPAQVGAVLAAFAGIALVVAG